MRVTTAYEGGARDLIWQLKLNGAQAAGRPMARQMAELLNDNDNEFWLVPVPTATGRARRRGYDQAAILTRELSRQAELPYLDCLIRSGQTHQHGANRSKRPQQLEGSFRLKRPKLVQNKRILLIDDVMTTGATLAATAQVIKQAGAREVEAIVFARPS